LLPGGLALALPELTAANAFIFRIVHKDNLAWILDNGLHCRKSPVKDPNFVNIGLTDLTEKRHLWKVPKPPGGTLSDYIPFYFTPLSMMAYNIHTGRNVKQRGNDEIAILVSSLVELQKANVSFLFTDRHAATLDAKFFCEVSGLNVVDWKILQNRDFSRDNDDIGKTSRYQAEALVHDKMAISNLIQVACCDDNQKKWADNLVKQRGLTLEVTTNTGWYF
jgi:hypothetical protein